MQGPDKSFAGGRRQYRIAVNIGTDFYQIVGGADVKLFAFIGHAAAIAGIHDIQKGVTPPPEQGDVSGINEMTMALPSRIWTPLITRSPS